MSLVPTFPDAQAAAAAALLRAGQLAPAVAGPVAVLLDRPGAADLADLAGRLQSTALFEASTRSALARLEAEVEAAVARETTERTDWVPVRFIDGEEEFEPVVREVRSRRGEALATVGARIAALRAALAETEALRTAADLFGR